MGRASGGSNTPHWIRNNILDFLLVREKSGNSGGILIQAFSMNPVPPFCHVHNQQEFLLLCMAEIIALI